MTTVEALFLGIVQGLTEFLPVSSSGHLTFIQALFGFRDLQGFIIFDLICHLGTLLAIFCVFYQDIYLSFKNKTKGGQIVLATLPLFPLVLLLKPIKNLFNQTEFLGFFFMLTALLLYVGIRFGSQLPETSLKKHRWRDALIVGTFQAVAILPGVSRSGSTISGARLLGWSPQEAITFSFLLAIPAILGGTTLEILQLTLKPHPLPEINSLNYAAGFFTSFFVGWGTLLLLKQLAAKQKFMYFVWYCLAIGIFAAFYFNT